MKKLFCFIGILPILCFSFPTYSFGAKAFSVFPKKNTSISFLCFKHYDRFDPLMIKHIGPKNPSVKNWGSLPVGKKLILPSKDEMGNLVPQKNQETVAITYFRPPVFVFRGDKGKPMPAEINMALAKNDRIKVGYGGRAEIMATGPRLIRLSQSSTLNVSSLSRDSKKKSFVSRFRLMLGKVWGKVLKFRKKKGHGLYVGSPTAIVGIRGTAYDMKVHEDESTSVRVFEGKVEIYNPLQKSVASGVTQTPKKVYKVQGPHKVKGPHKVSEEEWNEIVLQQYQQILITKQGMGKPMAFDYWRERETDWVKWNEERDKALLTK